MYGWRERSPIRYPTPPRPKRSKSFSQQRLSKRSFSRDKTPSTPMLEYRCAGGTETLTLRTVTDGLPTPGDLRNVLTKKREPPREKRPGVIEHVVQDYRYPQTYHEIQMRRHDHTANPMGAKGEIKEPEMKPQLTEIGADSTTVGTLGACSLPNDSLHHKTAVVMRKNVVDGDQDDQQRFNEYMKKRPMTSDDFQPCQCRGKGVQVWMRLCGCGCLL